MNKKPKNSRSLREPVQVYLTADDSALLSRLVEESGLSKAEVLRRGIRSFAAQHGGASPMLRFIDESSTGKWPEAVAADHDTVLATAYRAPRKKRS